MRAWRVQASLLAKLEAEVRDRSMPLGDLLRDCLVLSRHVGAARLQAWVTAELNGYLRIRDVPDYRKIRAPVMQAVDSPYLGRSTRLLNILSLPEPIREHISETVPLNQGVDELEAMADLHEAQNRLVELGNVASDAYATIWNKNPHRAFDVVALYWAVSPASIRGVLGLIRTTLTGFVVETADRGGR